MTPELWQRVDKLLGEALDGRPASGSLSSTTPAPTIRICADESRPVEFARGMRRLSRHQRPGRRSQSAARTTSPTKRGPSRAAVGRLHGAGNARRRRDGSLSRARHSSRPGCRNQGVASHALRSTPIVWAGSNVRHKCSPHSTTEYRSDLRYRGGMAFWPSSSSWWKAQHLPIASRMGRFSQRSVAHRASDRRGTRSHTRARHHSSGPDTIERQAAARWLHQGAGLRLGADSRGQGEWRNRRRSGIDINGW